MTDFSLKYSKYTAAEQLKQVYADGWVRGLKYGIIITAVAMIAAFGLGYLSCRVCVANLSSALLE